MNQVWSPPYFGLSLLLSTTGAPAAPPPPTSGGTPAAGRAVAYDNLDYYPMRLAA